MTLRTGLTRLCPRGQTGRSDSVGKGAGWAQRLGEASMRLCHPTVPLSFAPKSALLAEPRQIEASREWHAVVPERQSGAVLEQGGMPEWREAIFNRRIGVVAVMLSAALGLGAGIEIRGLAHRNPGRR